MLLSAAVLLSAQTAVPDVVVEPSPARGETVYRITSAGCDISWTVHHTQVNAGIVQRRSKCGLPLDEQLARDARLMEKVRSEQPVSSFRTLFLGLLDTQPGLPLRLALLAKRSPQWDSHLGRPKQGPLDRLVVQLANESTLFEEWQQLFHRFGLRIRVSGVESVSVAEAGKLPFFGEWQKHGIQAADRVPYNGLVWFAVTQEAL